MGFFGGPDQGQNVGDIGERALTMGLGLMRRGKAGLIAMQVRKQEILEGVSLYQTLKERESNDQPTRLAMAALTRSGKFIPLGEPISLTVADLPFDMQGVRKIMLPTGVELRTAKDLKGQFVLFKDGFGVRLTCTQKSEKYGEQVCAEKMDPSQFAAAHDRIGKQFSGPEYFFEVDKGYSGENALVRMQEDRQGSIQVFKKTGEGSTEIEIRIRGLRRADTSLFKIDPTEIQKKIEAEVPGLLAKTGVAT